MTTKGDDGGFEKKEKKKKRSYGRNIDLIELVFSWSLENIFNEELYKTQVENIPISFESVENYFDSYTYPLLEETRADLCSSMKTISTAPFAEVDFIEEFKPYDSLIYSVKVDGWRNRFSERGKEPYRTLPGDVLLVTNSKPETVLDLEREGWTWTFASVMNITEDESGGSISCTQFKIKAAGPVEADGGMRKSLFVVFLMNITTSKRIWNSLHLFGNVTIINRVLCANSMVEGNCSRCDLQSNDMYDEQIIASLSSQLNQSQTKAILASLNRIKCNHMNYVELIWGPPGTGKTKTVSMLLFILLQMKCRTLTCAPTNVAITEVASRLVKLVKESVESDSAQDSMFCLLGDILLFGNNERLKVGSEFEDIYLDYRVKMLTECFVSLTGWKHCFNSMIDFLEGCVSHYQTHVENEMIKEQDHSYEKENGEVETLSFLEYARKRFKLISTSLRRCISILCTHVPKSVILEPNVKAMLWVMDLLDSLERMVFNENMVSEELEELFSCGLVDNSSECFRNIRMECISVLRKLVGSFRNLKLPTSGNESILKQFCFRSASMIFCTTSTSYKLHKMEIDPLNFLVIDEAAQLKECESTIPLQLQGIRHAILIGDECQLRAMVKSDVSAEVGYGRSLFERLSILNHSKHLLNTQYRMHPSISCFPNSRFYLNQITDAPNVTERSYERHYLPGPMFGPYSFINVYGGKEEADDDGHSRKNIVEVVVATKILQRLYKEWSLSKTKQNLSVGIISPYAAQVVAFQEKLGRKYENIDGFTLKVKSIDGFQGGEEDIIIISTVRSNAGGHIGFLSDPQRSNVALTRARHCLWILGNGKTLADSDSVWRKLVNDAKDRGCFFNADDDETLANVILEIKKDLDQLDDLLNADSLLFKNARWKVLFSDNFKKSFVKLKTSRIKKSVMNLLLKLSNGWRPKKRNVDSACESSPQVFKQFKVEGLYVVCTIDIVKESKYTQVLKVWDVLPLEDIPKLAKRLDGIFAMFNDDFIERCSEKFLAGDFEIPKTWATSFEIVRYKNLANMEAADDPDAGSFEGRSYVENSKVSESLLLMKFYSLSSGVVNHLLSSCDGSELDLPFEVTDQELEMIVFSKSSFILGRSGTGKTTVLTMKLYQKEQQHMIASQGFHKEADESSSCSSILRQIFVTVSPKLCHAIKQHVSHLKSFAHGGSFSAKDSLIDMDGIDDATQFQDIPDSFLDIPPNSYPLVITFQKFLIMLDGTLGSSYFDRFSDVRELSLGITASSRSVALLSFIKMKEVTYDKFSLSYWPHFNTQLTKKLDSMRVFTEIISHIKGGLQAGESCDGKLSREDYVQQSEIRVSTLSQQQREIIYDIYLDYEKKKAEKSEFDLADLVNDLHRRLGYEKYMGEAMDFVYIDEVQDLTMRQIALFKYICKNVDEGFVFSGDTAQTIARGIDFRFQDIRTLFYKEFLLESRSDGNIRRNEKGQISEIFHLSQNFRTHAGVLKLSQSVIEILYRFFPSFIDVLGPETSLIYGEAPILLESGSDDNAIIKIFGNSGNVREKVVGFGAEQVILVRDDDARKEISQYVGKQALVLTIVECKGLEFQDVLLYNFFGSSPLKNQWRVIYQYMKEQDLIDENSPRAFPEFSHAKHNVLCSELKQLYVAITRTRQRLWISENAEEVSKPMFEYWKKMCIVQVRQLDDSLAQAMQVASTPEEWTNRGIKLFQENNFEMATMCFERAGDIKNEKWARAAGLKAAAERMLDSNSEMARATLLEAADLFDSIGQHGRSGDCYLQLKDYERAGKIYLEKCGEKRLIDAGKCFHLAGCYQVAAEAYAKGNYYAECLSVCTDGKFFEMGLQFIEQWKQRETTDVDIVKRGHDIDILEQEFLERCARHYHNLGDKVSMMKFVKAFRSTDLRRTFLKNLDYHGELMLLEEESGNFLEAASIAKQVGDLLRGAEFLERAGCLEESSVLILSHVFGNSLWASGSKGWPLKQFAEKEELLAKAQSLAHDFSERFYELVSADAAILSNRETSLPELKKHLVTSRNLENLRGEILSTRRILDSILHLHTSKYEWEYQLVTDLKMHSELWASMNSVSLESLVYFWDCWKEKIVRIFEYLKCLETQDVYEDTSYEDFCLSYFSAQKQFNNVNTMYLLLNPNAEWVREINERSLRRNGKLVFIDARQFVSSAWSYWSSELFSVGMKVLQTLEALYNHSTKNPDSGFCRSKVLVNIFQVAKFLNESKNHKHRDGRALQRFLQLPINDFFGLVFPLNWLKPLAENMISLRETKTSMILLKEVVYDSISSKSKVTYGENGRIAMILLGSGKQPAEVYDQFMKKSNHSPTWSAFIELLSGKTEAETSKEMDMVLKLREALDDTFNVNWRHVVDYISPGCFFYLMERLLVITTCFNGYFFTTKSSFVEWLVFQEWSVNPSSGFLIGMQPDIGSIHRLVGGIVQLFASAEYEAREWVKKSIPVGENWYPYYQVIVLRLVIVSALLFLNYPQTMFYDLLAHCLTMKSISSHLPGEFRGVLGKMRSRSHVNVFAELLKKIENPLVVVSLGRKYSGFLSSDAVVVDMMAKPSRKDILRVLFPEILSVSQSPKSYVKVEPEGQCSKLKLPLKIDEEMKNSKTPPSEAAPAVNQQEIEFRNDQVEQLNPEKQFGEFWKVFDDLKLVENGNEEDLKSFVSNSIKFKVRVQNNLLLMSSAAVTSSLGTIHCHDEDFVEAQKMLETTKQLFSALETSKKKLEKNIPTIRELSKTLQQTRPRVESFLNRLFSENSSNVTKSSEENKTEVEKNGGSDEKTEVQSEEGNDSNGEGKTEATSEQNNGEKQQKNEGNKKKGKNKQKNKRGGKGGKRK